MSKTTEIEQNKGEDCDDEDMGFMDKIKSLMGCNESEDSGIKKID